jgi:hypothetical protein
MTGHAAGSLTPANPALHKACESMPCLRPNASPVLVPAAGGRAAFRVSAGTSRAEDIQSKCSCLAIHKKKATAREHLEQEEVKYQCQPASEALNQTFVLVKRETALSGTFGVTPVGSETVTVLGSMELRIEEGQMISSQASANFPLPEGVSLQGGTILLTSPPVAPGNMASYDLLPIEIKWEAKPEFANVDDNPDPWTNQSNGKRIFVGATEDDHDGEMRRELNVKVRIPGYSNQPVYLKVFDVDDPSQVSNGQVLDPNGPAGDDNMHAVGLGDNWGYFLPQRSKQVTATLDSAGEATVQFMVNQQPGNNYRVAVAIKESDLNSLQVSGPGSGFVTADSSAVSGFNGALTPMLTVWRKLHIEVDSMAAPTAEKESPDRVLATGDHWDWDASSGMNRPRLYLAGSLPEGNNFYERGLLKAGGAEYRIFESGTNWVSLASGPTSFPSGFVGAVEILDDDDRGLAGVPLPHMTVITQGVKDIYKRAYIDIVPRSTNPTTSIPFKQYTSVVHPFLADSSLNDAIDTNGDDWGGFWNHYVIVSYQPHKSVAGDPIGALLEGATMPTGYGPRYSVVFIESIRDGVAGYGDPNIGALNTRIDEVVAHEIGHSPNDPGGFFDDHPEPGLMGAGAPAHHFSAESLKRFRQVNRWQEP